MCVYVDMEDRDRYSNNSKNVLSFFFLPSIVFTMITVYSTPFNSIFCVLLDSTGKMIHCYCYVMCVMCLLFVSQFCLFLLRFVFICTVRMRCDFCITLTLIKHRHVLIGQPIIHDNIY